MAQPIGASNLASGLRDAYMARSPVIAISGGPATASRYRHSYQEVEDFEQFDGVTKANMNVDSPERLPDLMRQAFRTATSGMPGPVHLRFQGRNSDVPLGDLDAETIVEQQFTRVPAFRPEPEPERVKEAAVSQKPRSRSSCRGRRMLSQAQAGSSRSPRSCRSRCHLAHGKGTILDTQRCPSA